MLELRPTCEHCDKSLPPDTNDARICSFECTFCCDCAEHLFAGVCPNCGGNFVPRPIRPARDWKGGNFLGRYPACAQACGREFARGAGRARRRSRPHAVVKPD